MILFSKLHIHIYGLAFTICCSLILVEKFLRLKSVELLQSHGNCWRLFLILRNHPIKLSSYASMCTFTYCTAVIEYIYIYMSLFFGRKFGPGHTWWRYHSSMGLAQLQIAYWRHTRCFWRYQTAYLLMCFIFDYMLFLSYGFDKFICKKPFICLIISLCGFFEVPFRLESLD